MISIKKIFQDNTPQSGVSLRSKKQTVLLTGAARGIGSSTAQFLARAGFDLILLDLKKGPWQKQALNLGLEHKVKVQTFVLDITKVEQIKKLAKKLQNQKIDVLINNAGFLSAHDLLTNYKDQEISLTLQVNLFGLIMMTKYFIPFLQKTNGLLVNIASGAGLKGMAEFSVYCASKFGVVGFSESLAEELKKKVKVLVITPGATNTVLFKKGFGAKRKALYQPEDIAKIIGEAVIYQKKYKSGEIIDKCKHLEP
ncbi:SDR family oxidoreductase [Patescibacteria group bacterium]|nr:SDR family oxidoreductase [Patescibacteria group bacterium]